LSAGSIVTSSTPMRAALLTIALGLLALLTPATSLPATAPHTPQGPAQTPTAPPAVRVEWQPRGAKQALEHTFELQPEDWVRNDSGRSARLTQRIDEVAFLVWFEEFDGVSATRITVGAINGLQNAGPRYFQRYAVRVGDQVLADIRGKHVILPRGALLRRTSVGPRATLLREWTYVQENRPVPDWAVAAAHKDTASRYALPFRNLRGEAVNLGPYNFFWTNKGLEDSHGGWGVGPFHGGPEDWLQCAAGRKNREAEMLLGFQRPIWMLDDDFEPLELQVPYWMGRTLQHEPPQYQYELDEWCPYAATLARYKFADYTHLTRGTSGAAALAGWDVVAHECLGAVLNDFKTANSLTRVVGEDDEGNPILHPGALQKNALLFPLWKKIETVKGPTSSGGDRGLAHWLRLLRWCRPYFPAEELEPWEEGLRQLVRGLADQYGVTYASTNPRYLSEPGGPLTVPLEPPYCQTFHQQLVTYECQRFGGLDDIGEKGARFLTARPPAYFEVRPGKQSDTVRDRHSTADPRQEEKLWSYGAYGNFTHDLLMGFDSPKAFVAEMRSRGVNGSSQDIDCTPRHVWEPGLH